MHGISSVSVIDLAAAAFILMSGLVGLRRRLSGELAGFIGIAVGFALGLIFFRPLGSRLLEWSRLSPRSADMLAFTAIIAASQCVLLPIRLLLRQIFKLAVEEKADRIGGVIAGLVRSALIVAIVFSAMIMWPHEYLNRTFGAESLIGRGLIKCMPPLREVMIEQGLIENTTEQQRAGEAGAPAWFRPPPQPAPDAVSDDAVEPEKADSNNTGPGRRIGARRPQRE